MRTDVALTTPLLVAPIAVTVSPGLMPETFVVTDFVTVELSGTFTLTVLPSAVVT